MYALRAAVLFILLLAPGTISAARLSDKAIRELRKEVIRHRSPNVLDPRQGPKLYMYDTSPEYGPFIGLRSH